MIGKKWLYPETLHRLQAISEGKSEKHSADKSVGCAEDECSLKRTVVSFYGLGNFIN